MSEWNILDQEIYSFLKISQQQEYGLLLLTAINFPISLRLKA